MVLVNGGEVVAEAVLLFPTCSCSQRGRQRFRKEDCWAVREAVRQRYALWLFAWVRLATAAFCWLCCPEKEGAARRGRGAAGRCGACAGGAAGVWAPLIYIEWGCGKLSKINNAGEQPVGADAEHPELEPVQLRA